MRLVALAAVLALTSCSEQERDKPSSSASADVADYDAAMALQGSVTRQPNPAMAAAPKGLPRQIAEAAILQTGRRCPSVGFALRIPSNGTIEAQCNGGDAYRVFTDPDDKTVRAILCRPTNTMTANGACLD